MVQGKKSTHRRTAVVVGAGMVTAIVAGLTAPMASAAVITIGDSAEQQIQDASAIVNIQSLGYGNIKYNVTTGRKEYFQFNLTGQTPDYTQAATFSVTTGTSGNGGSNQSLALYALQQDYDSFASTTLTTNTPVYAANGVSGAGSTSGTNAQANTAPGFASTGSFTAAQVATLTTGNGSATANVGSNVVLSFTLPAGWNQYVFTGPNVGTELTLAITGTATVVGATPLRIADQASAAAPSATPLTSLTFTPATTSVPEPASIGLITLGGLAFVRRRR